ncbi:MAG: hypothetical protein ABTS22_05950 [Accumulibacter sp.]|mgnify:CR=1 FL=1|jgi:hypothetical protein|uniref:hypothetical protein n=1 Tax=Accumulibacter sp. TaxID=2053492 RepID=UPI002B5B8DEF|nr:hypothetical protein [Candidatus Competibacter sp.]
MKSMLFLVVILLTVSQISIAQIGFGGGDWLGHDSNKREIRDELQSNNWFVVYGKPVEEGDMGVMAACTYFGCLSNYFEYYLDDTINRIERQMPGLTHDILVQLIENCFKYKGQIFSHLTLQMQAGIATYRRWKRVVYNEPRTYECKQPLPFGGWTWSVCTTTEEVEKEISLPNHHQPYLRFRFF